MAEAEQLTGPVAYHAEGPVWHDRLHWVDMLAGDVLTLTEEGAVERRHIASVVAALRPRLGGGFVYAIERGFALDRGPGTLVEPLPDVWDDAGLRMNEGGCDPDGRFYCGSMAYDHAPGVASLYRLDTDHSVTPVLTGATISNGLEWSPDGTRAYYADSPTGRIDVFDYDPDRGLTDRRTFVTIDGGSPDGLTVDAEGGVWSAVWGGGAVHGYSPDGVLAAVVELPVSQVTACTFGGDDLEDLFITTSRENLSDPDDVQSGALFVVRPGAKGRRVRPFAG